ncbi:MAG TPA: hypothetical protein VJ276_24245 [Thermoanaerobaculia bacterium]|nr:hypothetical protein [Thermoanaerobaculia bacterium]
MAQLALHADRGYFSTGDGTVGSVIVTDGKQSVGVVFRRRARHPRYAVGWLVRPPRLRQPVRLKSKANPPVSGLVIIQADFSETGAVTQTRVLKAIYGTAPYIAEDLVRRSEFSPATFLGHPVPANYLVSIDVANGIVSFRQAPAQ